MVAGCHISRLLASVCVPYSMCFVFRRLPVMQHVTRDALCAQLILLLGGELLAERCRTDDLMPSISLLPGRQLILRALKSVLQIT